jgi:putative transposase
VRILAYCLMDNHIHVVAAPEFEDSLATAFRRAHGRYAQYLNARKLRSGHLWQNRFYSCPMAESHLWTALRYVELNPVRAGLSAGPDQYDWSSAKAHLDGTDPSGILDMAFWRECGGSVNWRDLLGGAAEEAEERRLRNATYAGKPLGPEDFVNSLRKPPELAFAAGCGAAGAANAAPRASGGA